MLTLRFAAAFWLIYATLVLRPVPTLPRLQQLLAAFPELTVAALTCEMLPVLAGLACVVRWLRARPQDHRGALATATRWAALVSITGLLVPPLAGEAVSAGLVAYRAGQLGALLFLLDGPLIADE